MNLDTIGTYLDHNHWLITANRAGRLCKAFNGLPKHEYERRILIGDIYYWVCRTMHHQKCVWSIRPDRNQEVY